MDTLNVTGMVLSARPIGEYDNRIVLLTRERGKISAFAKGAKRPKSRLSAVGPFTWGQFEMHEGASSYTMFSAEVENYFEGLRSDVEGAYYGFYFLEIADYFARENNDEWEMLKLLYTTIRALERGTCDRDLIRCIFELRTLGVNGYGPRPQKMDLSPTGRYTVQYALEAPMKSLYAVKVGEETLKALRRENDKLLAEVIDRPIKSQEMLTIISHDN